MWNVDEVLMENDSHGAHRHALNSTNLSIWKEKEHKHLKSRVNLFRASSKAEMQGSGLGKKTHFSESQGHFQDNVISTSQMYCNVFLLTY